MQHLNTIGRTPGGKTPRRKGKIPPLLNPTTDPVKVFCRLRPLNTDFDESCVRLISPSTLILSLPDSVRVDSKEIQCTFDHIFTCYSDQKEIFDHIALPLLQGLLSGKNGLLFTYGVTGSGKTYTLNGEKNSPGILPRCVSMLFNTIENKQSTKYIIKSDKMNGFELQTEIEAEADRKQEKRNNMRTRGTPRKQDNQKFNYVNDGTRIVGLNDDNIYAVFISYIEIYNNVVYDLLDDSGGRILQSKIVKEDSQRCMYVHGVTELEVKTPEETFEQILVGQKRKRMADTVLNAESSRSHSIFNIRVVQLAAVARNSQGDVVIPERNLLTVGQLSLVDLAGSERCSRTQNTGVRLKEASSINSSLMNLRSCIEALRENQQNGTTRIVPYRDSRLTLLFRNFFEGDGAVKMIVCVNPDVSNYDENLQVMKFAEMAQDVQVAKPKVRHMPYRKTPKPPSRVLSAKTSSSSLNAAAAINYSCLFAAPLPKFTVDCNEESLSSMKTWIQCLQSRAEKRADYCKEIGDKSNTFRARLVELSQSDMNHDLDVQNLKVLLSQEKSKVITGNKIFIETEKEANALRVKLEDKDKQIQELRETVREKDLKLSKTVFEKERTKQKLHAQTEKMTHELENKLQRQRTLLESQRRVDSTKIQMLRKVLNDDFPVQEEPENVKPKENVLKPPAPAPPVLKRPVPVANRRHRRSRSVGEIWLEHIQKNPVPTGTLMQPTMNRRKSVTKLDKANDITNPKQNKYCLLAQGADEDGELETMLYKGDIVPTCGGGAQVIFNDVECLTQRSPTGTPLKSPRKPYNGAEQVVKKPRI